MDRVIALLEEGFRSLAAGTAANEPRRRVRAPGGALLHVMAAAVSGTGLQSCPRTSKNACPTGYLSAKVYSSSAEGARFFVLLFHSQNGRPLAFIEADYLGQMRTGAASGLATRYMAREDARVLALLR